MADFEVVERDGLARLGRLATPHGTLETPALLPVVHPDALRQPWRPAELERRLGFRGVITSAYLTWRIPELREAARREGIHKLLGFDGVVMTDSGAFQQHAYGSIEAGPEEIAGFQEEIGTDIATVLDVFTEPDASREVAEAAVRTTEERARAARLQRHGLLAVPVQGGAYPDLRARAARGGSADGDVLAIGGIVPLLEQYRFAELARDLAAARPHLAPEAAVHLFGVGHPMAFAFGALFGADLFDSSAYQKFARRGKLLFPEGTRDLAELREPICRCTLCGEHPLPEVRTWPAERREPHLALHNLLVSVEEIGRVRQAIRDGTLYELAERRSVAHPALSVGLSTAMAHGEVFEPTEPESRRAFRAIVPASLERPAVRRFRHRLASFCADRGPGRMIPRVPLVPLYLRWIPTADADGRELPWSATTPLGEVPIELSEIYPVGPYLGVEEFGERTPLPSPEALARQLARELGTAPSEALTEAWTGRQIRALLIWQYGRRAAGRLAPVLRGERSRKTGRLRTIRTSEGPAFTLGNDGLPRPTFRGAAALQAAVEPGRHRVVVAEDAVPFAREGRSVFSRFVVAADPALVPGASALVVGPRDELLAVGRLLLAPHEMGRLRRGVAVRVTSHAKAPDGGDADEEGPGPAAIYPQDLAKPPE